MNVFFLIFAALDAFILTFVIQHTYVSALLIENITPKVEILFMLILIMCWVLSIFIVSVVQRSNLNRLNNYLRALGYAGFIYGIGLIALFTPNKYTEISLYQVIIIFLFSFILFLANRIGLLIIYKLIYFWVAKRKSIVIVGSTKTAKRLINYFRKSKYFKNFLGIFEDEDFIRIDLAEYHLGTLQHVKEYCLINRVDEIYYTLHGNKSYLNDLRQFADEHFMYLGIVPEVDDSDDFRLKTNLIDDWDIPVISYERSPLSYKVNRLAKRALDFVVSFVALSSLGLTVFPVIAILIKISSKGPVFFNQLRSGRNCEPFLCHKFRTMKVNEEADIKQATENDVRVTTIGKILRKTNLDELPQFYNVLKGEMSVVGPRPHMLAQTDQYSAVISKYKVRHNIDAGITGFAQIHDFRGETKELSQMEKRISYDKWYLEHWSLFLDIKIIFLTIVNMFKGQKTAY